MQERKAVIAGATMFVALFVAAALLGHERRVAVSLDTRVSTFNTAPGGASALYQALPALGATVRRLRSRPGRLTSDTARAGEALLLLNPMAPVTTDDARALLNFRSRGGGLVIAGQMAGGLMRCFGYRVAPVVRAAAPDSARVVSRAGVTLPRYVRARLRTAPAVATRDSLNPLRRPSIACPAVTISRVDTLLATADGPAALRLHGAAAAGAVVLVADESLFANQALRDTPAGPWTVGLLAGYDRVTFDEYHQGYGPSGSLARALLAWSMRSPLGWGVWQAAIAGILALFAAGVRFGPRRTLGEERRRTSLEHVRALATALAASRGHDVAISALVQGLRRRLAPATRQRGSPRGWLEALPVATLPVAAQDSVRELRTLSAPGQDEAAVLRAANAVEDVWDTLRQSTPTNWRR